MSMSVQFVREPSASSKDEKLGTYDMDALPDVGETVLLKGIDYVVVSRLWQPKMLLMRVTITLREAV